MPIDMPLWNLVQENKAAVIGALIARFDPSQGNEYPIYSPEGEFSSWRFEQWLISAGITYWPRLDSGALQLDGDAFRLMYTAHPAIEGLHALRDSLGVIVRARIPIGPDGRNRPSLFPFGTATGRNAQSQVALQRPRLDALVHEGARRARSCFTWIGEPRKSALPRHAVATSNWPQTIWRATSITRWRRMCGLTNQDAKSWKATPRRQDTAPADEGAAARRSITAWA